MDPVPPRIRRILFGRLSLFLLILFPLFVFGCARFPAPASLSVPEGSSVLVGAGDIGHCLWKGNQATARLLDGIPGLVFTTGDNAYPEGSAEDFADCYDPSWGRHKERTRPSPGNHDYRTPGAAGYFDYFGAKAGEPDKGYYSYDLGGWHIIVLNSNIDVSAGSPQEAWLRADLASHPKRCTLAYWHHPLFSSGRRGKAAMKPVWQALYEAKTEIVLAGHDHVYERFAPQTPDGAADPGRGIRAFVVGTGGAGLDRFRTTAANSEFRYNRAYGVLRLVLNDGTYQWEFIAMLFPGRMRVVDSGNGSCH